MVDEKRSRGTQKRRWRNNIIKWIQFDLRSLNQATHDREFCELSECPFSYRRRVLSMMDNNTMKKYTIMNISIIIRLKSDMTTQTCITHGTTLYKVQRQNFTTLGDAVVSVGNSVLQGRISSPNQGQITHSTLLFIPQLRKTQMYLIFSNGIFAKLNAMKFADSNFVLCDVCIRHIRTLIQLVKCFNNDSASSKTTSDYQLIIQNAFLNTSSSFVVLILCTYLRSFAFLITFYSRHFPFLCL